MRINDQPTFPNDSALGRGIRVIMSGGALVAAGNDEDELGTLADDVTASDSVAAVVPFNHSGVKQFVAAGAVSQYETVFAAASGKVDNTGTLRRGIALKAASGDGAIIPVLVQGGSGAVV